MTDNLLASEMQRDESSVSSARLFHLLEMRDLIPGGAVDESADATDGGAAKTDEILNRRRKSSPAALGSPFEALNREGVLEDATTINRYLKKEDTKDLTGKGTSESKKVISDSLKSS